MATILDYIRWRGDLTFRERPLNEVDLLSFAVLAYVHFDEILSDSRKEGCSLSFAARRYTELGIPNSGRFLNPEPVLFALAKSPRYEGLFLRGYVDTLDPEWVQFGALTIDLPTGETVVTFRGTDSSLIGWKEDFLLMVQDRTSGQELAVSYLNRMLEAGTGPVYVCGHSKGGNLSIYGAAFGSPQIKARIKKICSFDGPGFRLGVLKQPTFLEISGRCTLITPENSMIGIILNNPGTRRIIKSEDNGIQQHNPLNWLVGPEKYEEASSPSKKSRLLQKALNSWMEELPDESKADFINSLFDTLGASGEDTFAEIREEGLDAYAAVLKAFSRLSTASQKNARRVLRKLISAGGESLKDGLRSSLPAGESIKEELKAFLERFFGPDEKEAEPDDTETALPQTESEPEEAGREKPSD